MRQLAVDLEIDALGEARQGEVDLGVGADHVGQRLLGLVEPAVVLLAVLVGVEAGVARGAVAEGVGPGEVGEHAPRGVDDHQKAPPGVGQRGLAAGGGAGDAVVGVDQGRVGGGLALRHGLGAGPRAAGHVAQALVHLSVEVVVIAVAELADVLAGELQLAGAAAGLTLADGAGAAVGPRDVEGRLGGDGRRHAGEHRDDPAAAAAAAVVTGAAGVLRAAGAARAGLLGVGVAPQGARRADLGCDADGDLIAHQQQRAAGPAAARVIAVAAAALTVGADCTLDRQGAALAAVHRGQHDAASPGPGDAAAPAVAVPAALVAACRAELDLVDRVLVGHTGDAGQRVVVVAAADGGAAVAAALGPAGLLKLLRELAGVGRRDDEAVLGAPAAPAKVRPTTT